MRRPRSSLLLAALLAVPAATGPAAPARAETVAVPAAVPRVCQDVLREGAPGVAVRRYTAPQAGVVTVKLDGRSGDWDLALFRSDGRPDTASAAFGPRERAEAYLTAGQTLVAQACRRRGSSATAALTFGLYPYVPPADRPKASLVRVRLDGPGDLARLEDAGLDVTHARDARSVVVALYGPRDAEALRERGLQFTTLVDDLRASDRRSARVDAARSAAAGRSLASGRTTYRTYADYGTDLKALAEDNPGLVRPVVAGTSLEGRPIEGVEISEGVDRGDDGRPVLALFGLHHAREWPSGEMPMEFAIDLVKHYRAGDARWTDILRRARVLVLPVVNPDGFVVSRSANGGTTTAADDGTADAATLGLAVNDQQAYKRKNCRPTLGDGAAPCALRSNSGVDLNRNYGAYWGGPGSTADATAQDYRGPAPYSEPESAAIHRLSQTRSPVTVISHHTFTADGKWLRQPGFCMVPPSGCQLNVDVTPDEPGMKALGDAMAGATGWTSHLGWDFNGGSEITGATEDWNYFATGAYGYTPEQRAPNFHPSFATAVAAEYDGSGAGADGGVREALLRAAAQAADRAQHSVLTGAAPAGHVLRLVKRFTTPTSQAGVVVDDRLDLALTVPAPGRFEWDVNPSTRPLASTREAYTLRCETPAGALVAARDVVVDRGRRLDVGDACAVAVPAPAAPAASAPAAGRPGATTTPLRLTLRLERRQRRGTVLRRGVLAQATCAVACTLVASVRKPAGTRGQTVLGRRTLKLRAGRRAQFRIRLSRSGRRAVERRRLSRVTLRLEARAGTRRIVRSRRVQLAR